MDLGVGRVGDRDLGISAQEIVTGRTCVIAQSGAGKSWGIAVLCEHLCRSYIGFCLIDTEGEYFSLKDRFPIIWIGSDEDCDFDIETVDLYSVMRDAISSSRQIIFDVSEVDMRVKATALVNILYEIESEMRKPYLLIVEEADKFIPQSRESIKMIEEISRRGRKRGLGLLVATQRPSLVQKNVLSQCNNQIIGKLTIDNDLKAVAHFFNARKEVEELITLEPGEFFVMGGLVREKILMKFGERETKHRGVTPQIIAGVPVVTNPDPVQKAEEPGVAVTAPVEAETEEAEEEEDSTIILPGSPLPKVNEADNAIPPSIRREEAIRIAQRFCRRSFWMRRYLDRVTALERVSWPLFCVWVKYHGGILKKTTRKASFIIEGFHGGKVDLSDGLLIRPGFSELLGLEEQQVRTLAVLTQSPLTLPELEAETSLSQAEVKKAIRILQKKRQITEMKNEAGATVYLPLLEQPIPKLSSLDQMLHHTLKPLGGGSRTPVVTEVALRKVLKGLEPTAEITKFQTIYYPVYEATIATDNGEKTIFIDGVTGREITGLSD
ncbi:MAG: DUF87 domain-containing protein [Methanocalculus sp. MSAO_Arc1]|uniref:ATP-binding protein n=1 Tax=Methanocalculus TaxID=71151 RepID=UPI000FED30A0|nr:MULTISPECIES: DUF87 domain-containing protein [unclassified Methanocalculus]MCP1662732.1 DNA-binding MarR family transcriptional regulator [Methanocalculus sp. AMF5]RQD80683.1 MAG: DUF87 domain-containing protein [Methanocalculus sp. MSAO_Arc1]